MVEDREASIARFQRRTRATDEATLRRNIEAGVYGVAGSGTRAVAEVALARRVSAGVESTALVRAPELEAVRSEAARARRWAAVSLALALVAALVAVAALVLPSLGG